MSPSRLFQPVKLGNNTLEHRVVLAPLTRFRGTQKDHVPTPWMTTYYTQRASSPGSLLITEGTFISPQAGGHDNVPGIWSEAQIAAWRKVTDGVHAKGSFIFMQLWALGRAAKPHLLEENGYELVSASDIPIVPGNQAPRPLTIPEIEEYVQQYAQAAHNAVHGAGFDGVEIHNAGGFLPDQFLQDVSNQRTDAYGGSVEARSRFPLEVVDAVANAVGAERTGIRLSPWGSVKSMHMAEPIPQFTHFVRSLVAANPNLAYIHAVESDTPGNSESNDFMRAIWAPRPFITCNNYTRETAIAHVDATGDLVAFGRPYIANPDLPTRLLKDIPLTPCDFSTFYTSGHLPDTEHGYTDYPFASDVKVQA